METDYNWFNKDVMTVCQELSHFLNPCGGVINEERMTLFIKLMKTCESMTHRCLYLNIIKATKEPKVLERFLISGGWSQLSSWLKMAKISRNMDLVLEVLQLCQKLPLRVDHLKQNSIPKLVKHFTKYGQPKDKDQGLQDTPAPVSSPVVLAVQKTASQLMVLWLKVIKDAKLESSEKAEDSKEKAQKISSKQKSSTEVKNGDKQIKSEEKKAVATAKSNSAVAEKKSVSVKRVTTDPERSPVPDKKSKPEPSKKSKVAFSGGFMAAINNQISQPPTQSKSKQQKRKTNVKPKPKPASVATSLNPIDIPTGEAGDFDEDENSGGSSSKPEETALPARPVTLGKNGKPKKRVRWANDNCLEAVRYFECEEGERVNVNSQSFKDAMARERLLERQRFDESHGDAWKVPPKIEGLSEAIAERGHLSTEKITQRNREAKVLQSIYLTRDMIPDCPASPEHREPLSDTPPKTIPLGDMSMLGNGAGSHDNDEDDVSTAPHNPEASERLHPVKDVEKPDNNMCVPMEMQYEPIRPGHPFPHVGPILAHNGGPYYHPMMRMPPAGVVPMEWTPGGPMPHMNMRHRMRGPMPFPYRPGPNVWRPRGGNARMPPRYPPNYR